MSIYRKPITIQVNIGAATAPTLDAYVIAHPPKLRLGLGYTPAEAASHRAWIETIIQPSAAVTRKAVNIGVGSEAGALIRKVALFHANLTSFAVKKNGFDIFDDVDVALNSYIQDDIFARSPAAGRYVWDSIEDGNVSDALTTINPDGNPANYQALITTSAGDTITGYADVLTQLPRL